MFLKLIRCTGMLYCYRSVTYLLRLKKNAVCKNFHFITYKMIKKRTIGIILIMINCKISNRVL